MHSIGGGAQSRPRFADRAELAVSVWGAISADDMRTFDTRVCGGQVRTLSS